MSSTEENSLKLQCLEIASRELLETKGFIKQEELMKRARQLYVAAKVSGFDSWNMQAIKQEEPQPVIKTENVVDTPKPTPIKIVEVNNGFKICPNCNEEVPAKFRAHKYRQDGSVCGQKFEVSQ